MADHLSGVDRPGGPDDAHAQRRFVLLSIVSGVCGVGAFAVSLWMSALLSPVDGAPVQLGSAVLLSGVVFIALLTGCIVLGYVAARRRPRRR